MAAVPHRARAPDLPRARTGTQYQNVNRRFADGGVRGGRSRRPHRARAGLPLRARAEADPRAAAEGDDPHLLAHPLAQRRAPGHLPLARGAHLGAAWARRIVGFHTQQHCNNFIESVDAFMESRIDRERNAVVQGTRTTLVRPYPISIEWPVQWVDEVAAHRRLPRPGAHGAGARPRRAARRGHRSPRLHQGHRGAAAGGRRAARAAPGVPRPLHLRPARRAEPHQDRPLPGAHRAHRGARRRASTPSGRTAATGPSRCCARTTSRRRCYRYYRAAELCYVSQPPRRHEPGGEGVRRRPRRRAGRAGALAVHRRGARPDRGADRQPLRRARRPARPWPPRCTCRRSEQRERMRSMRRRVSRVQRLPLGGADAHATPPSCGATSAPPTGSRCPPRQCRRLP